MVPSRPNVKNANSSGLLVYAFIILTDGKETLLPLELDTPYDFSLQIKNK